MNPVSREELNTFKNWIEERFERINLRLKMLEELERKTALLTLRVNSQAVDAHRTVEALEEYDFVFLHNGQGPRWIWKHFLRGARSHASFASYDEASADAARDAQLHARHVRSAMNGHHPRTREAHA